MDLPQHDEWYSRAGISLNGNGVIVGDVGFFGVSGGPVSPLRTPYEITEDEILARSEAGFLMVKSCRRKVFVPHAPPYGTKLDIIHAGYHVGSTAVREFIEITQPDVAVCGHIHEARGQDAINHTKIVNCGHGHHGYYALINIGKDIHILNKQLAL
jgi:Icc-related predicted phosphoesterase